MRKRKPEKPERGFVPALAERLAASLLPVDTALTGPALAAAAQFVADAANRRERGTPAIAIDW